MIDSDVDPVEEDDPAIDDGETALRRLSDSGPSMIAIDIVTGERRPSTGAFRPDEDGVSVYRESVLQTNNLTAADLVRTPQNLVVGVAVGEIRSIASLGIRDDPWPSDFGEPDHPRNVAHALIVGWRGLTKNERKRRQLLLVTLPSLRFVHP